jgi:lipopolysaccharide biosynthesis protein
MQYWAIKRAAVFDAGYYLAQNPDVRMADIDPLRHYIRNGWQEGRNPSARFDTHWYLAQHPDAQQTGINPLLHYIRQPARERLATRPLMGGSTSKGGKRLLTREAQHWDKPRETAFLASLKAQQTDALRVSIIMPTYNRADTIGAAIASVQGQSHQNWRLLVIDDGGSDDTEAVIRALADERVEYHRIDHGGVSAARNEGLRKATGDYVFFLDSDNRWRPHFLQTMLAFMLRDELPAAYCAAEVTSESQPVWYLGNDFDLASLIDRNFIDLNTFGLRNPHGEVLFDTTIRRLVDWDFILHFALRERLGFAPFIGVDYYNGTQGQRITRSEYGKSADFRALIGYVQNKASNGLWQQSQRAARVEGKPSVAVVLHVFHPQHIAQLLEAAEQVPPPFDLFVTTPLEAQHSVICQLRERYPTAQVLHFPNLGRDVAPFLSLLPTLMKYDLVAKLHTKRDMPGKAGHRWREYTLDALLGGREGIEQVLAAFAEHPQMQMAGPAPFYVTGARSSGHLPVFLQRTGHDVLLPSAKGNDWGFFAGTMFWCRPCSLAPLLSLSEQVEFHAGLHRDDGLPEHHFERLFGLVQQAAQVGLVGVDKAGAVTVDVKPAVSAHRDVSIDEVLAQLPSSSGKKLTAQAYSPPSPVVLSRPVVAPAPKRELPADTDITTLCFYLPQFHPTDFNDRHWGEGFTEWTNVTRARPRFDGHVQPKYPGKFGYYDLRIPGLMQEQGKLAAEYGVSGFCFYYYRFGNERVLDLPLRDYLKLGDDKLPFCFCWANESWTRAWDGKTAEVIFGQTYDDATLNGLADDVAEALQDSRYIRIGGRPLFLIYQVAEVPNPAEWTAKLREAINRRSGEEVLLGSVYSNGFTEDMLSFLDIVVQFPPHRILRPHKRKLMKPREVKPYEPQREDFYEAYSDVAEAALKGVDMIAPMIPAVTPDWDNAARRQNKAHTLVGSTPEAFGAWVAEAAAVARRKAAEGKLPEPLLFVNAWNEWAEGAMMEPSAEHGYAYLEALRDGLKKR